MFLTRSDVTVLKCRRRGATAASSRRPSRCSSHSFPVNVLLGLKRSEWSSAPTRPPCAPAAGATAGGQWSLVVHYGTFGLRGKLTPSTVSLRRWMQHKIKAFYFSSLITSSSHFAPPPAPLHITLLSLPIQFHAAVRDNSDIISCLHEFACS